MTRPRRRRWPWFVGSLAALMLAAVIAGVVVVRSSAFESWLAGVVVGELRKATHEEATLDRAVVTFWPPGVELRGLTLIEDESGEIIATVDRIAAPLALRDATVKLGRLTLDNPTVTLHLDEQGRLVEFRKPDDPDAPQQPPRPLRELPWRSLKINDLDVLVEIPEGRITVDGLDTTPVSGPVTDIAGRVDVQWREFSDGLDLDLRDVVLGPEIVEIPDLRLDLGSLQISGRAVVPLQGDLDADLAVHSELHTLSPLLTGPRYLEGAADADLRISGPLSNPVANVVVAATDFGYDAPGKVWPRIRYGVDAFSVVATARRDEIVVEQLIAREDDGRAVASGVVRPVAQPDGSSRWELVESDVVGEDISLAALLRAFSAAPNPWTDFSGDIEAHLAGPLVPLELYGPFEAVLADYTVTQGPVDDEAAPVMLRVPTATLVGALTIYKRHLLLDVDELVTPRNVGSVVADIGFGPKGPLDLSMDLTSADLADLRPLGESAMTGRGRLRGRLWGDFDSLQASGQGTLRGFSVGGIPYADVLDARIVSPDMRRLTLTEARGVRGQTRYLGTWSMDFAAQGLPMETDVTITEGRAEDLVSMFVDLGDIVTGDIIDGTLTLSGPLNDMDGVAHLYMKDVVLVGEPFETGEAHGWLSQGTFTLDDLRVRRGADEGLTLRGSVGREWALDMEGTGELRLESLSSLAPLELPLTGRASGVVRIDNTLFDPAPHGRLRLWDLAFADQPVPDTVIEAETTDGILLASADLVGTATHADFSIGLWDERPYTLLAALDSFPVDRLYPVAADGQEVLARVTGEVDLWGTLGEVPSPVEVRARLPRVVVGWDKHTLVNDPDTPWTFNATGGEWNLDGVALAGAGSRLSMQAARREGATLITGAGRVDADLLRAFVPGLTQANGHLTARLASLGGDGDGETHLDVELDAPLMRHDSVPAALEDVKLLADLTPEAFRITHFASDVGGGRIIGDAERQPRLAERLPSGPGVNAVGVIEADNWFPQRFDLLARAENVQMQWVEDLPPAIGNATIAFDGPADSLLLRADVDVVDMAFTDRIDWEDWVVALEEYLLVEAPPSDEPPWFGLDIDIDADRTIRLLNNVSDATASADLTIVGDTSRMGLVGRVRVEDGVVYVQDRAFDVQRGELRFDDAYSWDPLLDFDLRALIQSRARQYRVSYRISGPYSDWQSRTLSEPRLPQADINALLWFGVTADDLEDMGELTNAVSLAAIDFVAKDFVQNDYLGLGLQDAGLLDRLPEIDLNTGVNLRGEYSSEPRVLIRQRFSPTLSTQAEINLIRDDHFVRLDWRTNESLLLSSWWASRRREGFSLPFSGALGVDLRWVQEFD